MCSHIPYQKVAVLVALAPTLALALVLVARRLYANRRAGLSLFSGRLA